MASDPTQSPRVRALWISSDFWEKPATGGAHYSRSVLSALRASSSVEIVRTYVARWPPLSTWRKAEGLAKSFARGSSVFRHVCTDPALAEGLRDGLLENTDAVVVNGSDQVLSIRDVPASVDVIYVMHNLDADYISASIDGLPSWQRGLLALSDEVAKCVREEREILRRAKVVIGISLEELDAVKTKNPDAVT
ncbi:MAG: hypothetical protein JWP28_3332, partial [Phenylobacterium sp.]|uniref:hypothetical protein n=1 Tax=Phenylobacterium sp. TaxID=1871053 RepID=UPI002625F3F6